MCVVAKVGGVRSCLSVSLVSKRRWRSIHNRPPGFVAGSTWARSDRLPLRDELPLVSSVCSDWVRGGQTVWTFATAAVTPGQKRDLMKSSKDYKERLGATGVPLCCGEGIPHTHALWYLLWIRSNVCFPNVIFHSGVCVCVCDLPWDLKEDDDSEGTAYELSSW